MESVQLKIDDLQLSAGLFRPKGCGPHPTICICHGIPAQRTQGTADGGYPMLAERYCSYGFLVLIFNFRGTGSSEGNFDMVGWTRDLKVAIDYLVSLNESDKSRLSVMGFSGGAAATVYCAANDERISSVVTFACPARIFDISEFSIINKFLEHCRQVGIIRDVNFPLSVNEWAKGFDEISPIKWVDRLSPRPIIIIHGDNDRTVDPGQAWELYNKARQPKDISIIKGAEHKLRLNDQAINAALSWLIKINRIDGRN